MGLSGLCVVHCLASTIFFASIASVSGVLENHLFHEIGLIVAIGFALVSLVAGVLSNGYMMPFAVGSFALGMMKGPWIRPHSGAVVVATRMVVARFVRGHDGTRPPADRKTIPRTCGRQ